MYRNHTYLEPQTYHAVTTGAIAVAYFTKIRCILISQMDM